MSETLGHDVKKGLELLLEIKRQYPEGDFDREMLHGEMDFRYRKIKELRESLESLPASVRQFCIFVRSVGVSEPSLRSFLELLIREPVYFAVSPGQAFKEIRKRATTCSALIAVPASQIVQLLGRMRMNGILDQSYRLREDFQPILAAYLSI